MSIRPLLLLCTLMLAMPCASVAADNDQPAKTTIATWSLGCERKGRRMTLELCSKRSEARFLLIAGSRVTFSTDLFNGLVVEVAETSSMQSLVNFGVKCEEPKHY